MTIRQVAFDLCKALPALSGQCELASAVQNISNTHLHYLGHGQHAQAFGFLLIDTHRSEYERPPISIKLEPLDPKYREVFESYHRELLAINERCVKRLTDFRPNCSFDVLSPYSRFRPVSFGKKVTYDFFPKQETEALVEAFQKHPLTQIAIDSSAIFKTASPPQYVSAVLALEEEIRSSGTMQLPTRIKQILERVAPTASRWLETQHIASIVGLRASLAVLNQLLYTKAFMKILPCLDRDNIVSFGNYSFMTGGTNLVYQEGGLMFAVETDDIIVLKDVPPRDNETNFCRVDRLSPFLPPMPGETRYIELLKIDENLNPYGILFSDFYDPKIRK